MCAAPQVWSLTCATTSRCDLLDTMLPPPSPSSSPRRRRRLRVGHHLPPLPTRRRLRRHPPPSLAVPPLAAFSSRRRRLTRRLHLSRRRCLSHDRRLLSRHIRRRGRHDDAAPPPVAATRHPPPLSRARVIRVSARVRSRPLARLCSASDGCGHCNACGWVWFPWCVSGTARSPARDWLHPGARPRVTRETAALLGPLLG